MPIILPKTGMDQCISIKYTVDFDFMYIPRKKCESLQILFKEVYYNSRVETVLIAILLQIMS